MKLSEFKSELENLETIGFQLPNGTLVPPYFHVTEVGQFDKTFIDCGGVIRKEKTINFQLWSSTDYDHRLHPEKLIHIINLSEEKLGLEDLEIEVEYQGDTIGKFGIDFDGRNFLLTNTFTDCLAKDNCGIPEQKPRVRMSELQNACVPGTGCC